MILRQLTWNRLLLPVGIDALLPTARALVAAGSVIEGGQAAFEGRLGQLGSLAVGQAEWGGVGASGDDHGLPWSERPLVQGIALEVGPVWSWAG
jgi:hypothetical protein